MHKHTCTRTHTRLPSYAISWFWSHFSLTSSCSHLEIGWFYTFRGVTFTESFWVISEGGFSYPLTSHQLSFRGYLCIHIGCTKPPNNCNDIGTSQSGQMLASTLNQIVQYKATQVKSHLGRYTSCKNLLILFQSLLLLHAWTTCQCIFM